MLPPTGIDVRFSIFMDDCDRVTSRFRVGISLTLKVTLSDCK